MRKVPLPFRLLEAIRSTTQEAVRWLRERPHRHPDEPPPPSHTAP